jgi:hypothetical protein
MAEPFGMGNVDMNYYGPLEGERTMRAGGPGGPNPYGPNPVSFPQFFGGYDVKTQGGTRPGSFRGDQVGRPVRPRPVPLKPGAGQGPTFSNDRFGMPVIGQPNFGAGSGGLSGNQQTGPNTYAAGSSEKGSAGYINIPDIEQRVGGDPSQLNPNLRDVVSTYGPGSMPVDAVRTDRPEGPNMYGAMPNQYTPVLQKGQQVTEVQADPRLASLYFGSADTPGFIQQIQAAGAQALGQQVPLQQTAGLSPLEQAAIQQAYGGIGAFEPYLQAQEQSLQEAVAAERRAGEQMQPYFAQAEQQLGAGLGGLMGSLGRMGPSARDFQRASLVGFDPRSSQAFFNPFEQQVVQRTLDDAFQASEMQDIQQRARDIQAGGESAFGSRARLSAEERRRSLGRGLGEALAGIRQGGFENAMQRAQAESQFQRGALERAAGFERGLGSDELSARRGFAQDILGLGGQRAQLTRGIGSALAGYGAQFGGLGRERQDLGSRQRAELMNLGAVPRDLLQTRFDRQFQQQLAQQGRPLGILGQIAQLLPRFEGSQTRIDSTYGPPIDPRLAGLGAGVGAYRGFMGAEGFGGGN